MPGQSRTIDWAAQDPFLVGPYAAPEGRRAELFDVPSKQASGWRFTRIHSGPAWPGGLTRLDRLAALPDAPPPADGALEATVLFADDEAGRPTPLCVRREQRAHWQVDPAHWIQGLLGEAYVGEWKRPAQSHLPLLNYNYVPHAIKSILQPTAELDCNRSNELAFPHVPLDDLVEALRELCLSLAFDSPPRRADLWDGRRRAAVTLCHDVDTSWILEPARRQLLERILLAETELGLRGAWYVVANQLDRRRHAPALEAIRAAGHEIGAHGWNHDTRLPYLSEARQDRRMQKVSERLAGLEVSGVRTPWYGRDPQLMSVLARHFGYSSSTPNASPFYTTHSNSGCCTFFPFQREGIVELPLTLPPDTAGHADSLYPSLLRCAKTIVERGGVVVVTMHPQPHQSGSVAGSEAYLEFLRELDARHGELLWKAAPHEIVARYEERIRGVSRARQ